MVPHTAAKSESSGHIYSNSYRLLNSRTNECFAFTELPRSKRRKFRSPGNSTQRKLRIFNTQKLQMFVCVCVRVCVCLVSVDFAVCVAHLGAQSPQYAHEPLN